MASTLALRGVPAARRAEGPPSCGARASRATAGGVRASRRPRLAHAPWRSATPPPRAWTRARALAVDRGEALGDDDDALAELVFEGTDTKSRRARVSAGDERDVAETNVAVASEDFEYLHETLAASLSFDTQHPERQKAQTNEPAPSSNDDDTYDMPPKARVLQNASLGEYCTLGVGGAARAVVEAYTIDQLIATLKACASYGVESVVIGKGSNVLFSASGFDGVVIVNRVEFVQELDAVCDDDDDDASSGAKKTMTKTKKTRLFRVGSGTPFNALGASLSKKNWSGLEFAVGVPGTAGGAAFMNAGADGQDTAGVLESVELVSPCGRFRTTTKIVRRETKVGDDLEDAKNASEIDTSRTSSSAEESETLFVSSDAFGYRRSPFMERGGERADDGSSGLAGWIVTAVTFRLTRDSLAASRAREFMRRRRSTQPLAERSVGCLFRNPGAGLASAGAAIDRAGLKNFSIGAARVSSTHANFLVVDERNKFFSGGVSSPGAIDSRLPSTDSRDSFRAKKLSAKRGSRDMEALIAAVKARVLRDSGVVLEEEVRRVPFRFRADPTPKREKERKEKMPGADEKKNDDDGVDAEGSVRLEPGPR